MQFNKLSMRGCEHIMNPISGKPVSARTSGGSGDLNGDAGRARADRGARHGVDRGQGLIIVALDRAPERPEVDGETGGVRGLDRGVDVRSRCAVVERLHGEFDSQRHPGAP